MRTRLAAFTCVLVLAACSDGTETTAPMLPDDASLAATTFTQNEIVPLDFAVFVPCANDGAGELVHLEGYLHLLDHVTQNDHGFAVKQLANPQHVSGIGDVTGDQYQGTGGTQETFSVGPGESYTYVNNFRIIGQGPGNNSLVHDIFHVTVDPSGDVVTIVDHFTADCR